LAPAPEVAVPEPRPSPVDPPRAAVPVDAPTIELDDVILAWAAILPTFPPVTKAAAQEAQPIALTGNVVTFGVPKNLFAATKPRFQDQRDAIRDALAAQLGRVLQFKIEAVDGFGALPAPSTIPNGDAPSHEHEHEPEHEEDAIDLRDLSDLRRVLGLHRVPHFTTLQKASKRLLCRPRARRLLRRIRRHLINTRRTLAASFHESLLGERPLLDPVDP
jgi:hypothetical protein